MAAQQQQWPSVTLHDGTVHPQIGFGTYKVGYVPPSASSAAAGGAAGADAVDTRSVIGTAVGAGYRFFDCAQFYNNEADVGAALASAAVDRSDLFLASKCWSDTIYAGRKAVRAQIERSLRDLRTDYLDLYLVHWPVPGTHVDAYLELQDAQRAGLVRSIGVSNYAVEDLEELLADPRVTVKPTINQIELNPWLYRKNTLAFHDRKGIKVQAYRALRDGKAFDDPTVQAVAAKHGKSPAQVLGRWCIQKGAIYFPKSTKAGRIVENAQVLDFSLDVEDLGLLDRLTTPSTIETFRALYEKCVVRDTPLGLDDPGIKRHITAD